MCTVTPLPLTLTWNGSQIVAPAPVRLVADSMGWRTAFNGTGGLVLLIATGVAAVMLPATWMASSANTSASTSTSKGSAGSDQAKNAAAAPTARAGTGGTSGSLWTAFLTHVLPNAGYWCLVASNMVIYVLYKAWSEWGALALQSDKGMTVAGSLSMVAWLDVGGFFGSLLSGYMSDYMGGRRVLTSTVAAVALVPLGAAIGLLYGLPWLASALLMSLAGLCIHGIRSLVGLAASESVHASATGIAGTCSTHPLHPPWLPPVPC